MTPTSYARTAKTVVALRGMADSAHYMQIEHYAGLTEKVICQTRRRVLMGEKVPAQALLSKIN